MSYEADCHYGDHRWLTNGRCSVCDSFNGGWLAYQAYAKAEREGRIHNDHFHRTVKAREQCRTEWRYPEEPT